MTQKDRMLQGLPYQAADPALHAAYIQCARHLQAYNQTGIWDRPAMDETIRKILGKAGEGVLIVPPFHCDYGSNIEVGDHFYANYNLVILDVVQVTIGHHVMMGPNVALCTAGHPIHGLDRRSSWEWGAPITIGDDVWLGSNVVVNPGVTIGPGTVVGSGSVVTKDLPAWSLCVGNPCRVLRTITAADRAEYRKGFPWPDDWRDGRTAEN